MTFLFEGAAVVEPSASNNEIHIIFSQRLIKNITLSAYNALNNACAFLFVIL